MAYKSLLTILSGEEEVSSLLPAACDLAARFDAHLDVLCLGIDEIQMGYYFAGADMAIQQATFDQARERADKLTAEAETAMTNTGLRYRVHGAVAQFGILGEMVADVARFADLVVLGKPYGDNARPERETILEASLFSGGAPVLVLPETGLPENFGRIAVIGWNEGTEALHAVRAALPVLAESEKASVAIIDPAPHSRTQTDPGQSLSTLLDRHGVKAEISILAKTMPRIAQVLFSHAGDIEASLLVAGAYGHSRLRQAILGGATRDLLTDTPLPVLLAH